jgi:BirA family biotin operon repressor/biotin-[acetyl-CoA-carboxylase] ligase
MLSSLLTETFLRDVRHFEETDSTNTQSLQLIASGEAIETPLLIYAEAQSAGRGRGANTWWSQSGSLTFSLVIDMQELGLSPEQQPQLSLLTGLALLQTGQSLIPRGNFAVKWPNDVYLSGKKLAGILTEVPTGSPRRAVIGVGININNRFAAAPAELHESSISLVDHSGQSMDRGEVLKSFLQQLEEQFLQLAQGEPVLENWPEYCLLTGKTVTLQTGPHTVTGLCRGIDDSGALLLETEQGLQRMLGGTVSKWGSR